MIGSYHFSECVGCVVQKCVVLLLDKMCRNEHLVSDSNVSSIVSQITTHATHFNSVWGDKLTNKIMLECYV